MTIDSLTGPLSELLDRLIPDPAERDRAGRELRALDGTIKGAGVRDRLTAALSGNADPWTGRARPAFLYVMYALVLWSVPLGLIAAVRPAMADAIARGMTSYLGGIPEPMWALFGIGYLGYTAARTWGKVKGVE